MKLLLTSGGVTNPSIRGALVDLLGKPVEEARSWAEGISGPANALDDETAVQVDDGQVTWVSEGTWLELS